MEKIYLNIVNNIEMIPDYINNYKGKILIFSLIQENRNLENLFDIQDDIIYDNQDYFNNIIELENLIYEIDDKIHIVPSSYKMKISNYDFSKIINDISKLDYEYVIFLYDEKIKFENMPLFEKINEKINKKSFIQKILGVFKNE